MWQVLLRHPFHRWQLKAQKSHTSSHAEEQPPHQAGMWDGPQDSWPGPLNMPASFTNERGPFLGQQKKRRKRRENQTWFGILRRTPTWKLESGLRDIRGTSGQRRTRPASRVTLILARREAGTVLEREKVLTRRRDGPPEIGDRAVVPVTSCPRASSQSFSSGRVPGRLDASGPSYGSARLCRRLPSS